MKTHHLLLSFVAGIATGWFISGSRGAKPKEVEFLHTSDTIILRDTVRINSPVMQSARLLRTDTLRVPSAPGHDTVYIPLPVTQLHYRDSLAEAWVSGFRPRLDSLHVFPEKTVITNSITHRAKPARWHIGASAGITITPAGVAPGVTVGITYSIMDL